MFRLSSLLQTSFPPSCVFPSSLLRSFCPLPPYSRSSSFFSSKQKEDFGDKQNVPLNEKQDVPLTDHQNSPLKEKFKAKLNNQMQGQGNFDVDRVIIDERRKSSKLPMDHYDINTKNDFYGKNQGRTRTTEDVFNFNEPGLGRKSRYLKKIPLLAMFIFVACYKYMVWVMDTFL